MKSTSKQAYYTSKKIVSSASVSSLGLTTTQKTLISHKDDQIRLSMLSAETTSHDSLSSDRTLSTVPLTCKNKEIKQSKRKEMYKSRDEKIKTKLSVLNNSKHNTMPANSSSEN